jgi:type II secretory ATPase GspE/PulE/Tfp pilus assembly ATPase PilB-like protein
VSGPTGSGKTTTLYATLRERSTPGVKVVTVEDPVEVRLAGAVQLPVNLRTGFTFAQALRAMLRHDPDVLLVGEMRDAETAEIAVRAALTGHLVLSTVHTTDTVGALVRLRDMGVAPYLLAATLRAVLAQRLVRRVCRECAVDRVPSPAEVAALQEAGMTVNRVVEGRGCPACRGTGFHGRLAVGELLTVTDALTDAFCAGAPLATLRAVARAGGVRPLRQAGLRRAAAGQTTVAEVLRVTGNDPLS